MAGRLNRLFLVLIILALCGITTAAAEATPVRLITVTGEGEIWVEPDEAEIRLGVETFAADLGEAKTKNDQSIRNVLAVVKEFKIEEKYIHTSQINIHQRYSNEDDPTTLVGYSVQNTISVILRDITKYDGLISAALKAGANSIDSVEFRASEMAKYKEQALALAAKDAKSKAAKLAGELGQKIGRPYLIQEGASVNADQVYYAYGYTLNKATIVPGPLRIYAQVTVSFELGIA